MSQKEIYIILKELGGEATTKEIKEVAKKKFPNCTLHLYVTDRLKKLEKWGIVKRVENSWKIVKEFE